MAVTGEILHGKTSLLRHDEKGVYKGLPQDLPVTRYHSLAGTHPTLPRCLQISSWARPLSPEGKNVIMGVRHKNYVIEGVQFHPESILTAEGRTMLKNFLSMQGGTWEENEKLSRGTGTARSNVKEVNDSSGTAPQSQQPSILEKIFDHRKQAVAEQMQLPSFRRSDLQAAYDLGLAPPQISFPDRVRKAPFELSLMAEIKRASPSKGVISMDVCAPAQARAYAYAGTSVISVLTEPRWFKGSIEDLRTVRQSLEGMAHRPAVLRKEFIFSEYQILEARLAGADTVLLIVKMLEEQDLQRLYAYSKSLGMEPLVEVNNVEEMKIASRLNADVIGVNNRNLATFDVDLETTSRLVDAAPKRSMLCALSGIRGSKDVEPYLKKGVGAVLVGEALMRAPSPSDFVNDLFDTAKPRPIKSFDSSPGPLVKICGTRTPEAAKSAIESGADLIGMILVEDRKRYVIEETASAISKVVHNTKRTRMLNRMPEWKYEVQAVDFFTTGYRQLYREDRAMLVGVFQNQPLQHVLDQQRLFNLDVVQLHGDEPLEWASLIPVPVIKSFKPYQCQTLCKRGFHAAPLLDAGSGGSGKAVGMSDLKTCLAMDPKLNILLAGGLTPENVIEKLKSLGKFREQVVGVDVSSGVEGQDGVQDFEKIKKFIESATKYIG